MAFKEASVNGTIALNTSTSGTTSIGTGSNSGTLSLGNTSSGAVSIDCGTAGITVGATANNHTTALGTTSGTSTTNINAGSGGIGLTGVVTSANAITVTSGAITASSGNVVLSAGNVTLPTTSSTVGNVLINGNRFMHGQGGDSTFLGNNAGNHTLSGSQNVGLGAVALTAITSASNVTAVGQGAGFALTSGNTNSFFGELAGGQLTTGATNTLLGQGAGFGYTGAESNNIVVGVVAGTVGESAVIRIGVQGTQTKTVIAGIFGVTVGVTGVPVDVDNTGQLGTVVSSIRFKENVHDIGIESGRVFDLRPVTFNYKHDEHKSKRYGLIAEEVEKFLPELVVYDEDKNPLTIKYQDLPVLLLNEIIKLKQRIQLLESRE